MASIEFAVDARGDIHRGLQVVETAAGITSNLLGEHVEGTINANSMIHLTEIYAVSKDMDTYTRRVPLGVCARHVMHPYSCLTTLTLRL